MRSWSQRPRFTDEETEAQRFQRACPGLTGGVGMPPKVLALLGNGEAGSGGLAAGRGGAQVAPAPQPP
jgi:hypothetical protein